MEFWTPGICEKIKSMLNIAAIIHKLRAHVASVVSLALPVLRTSTTAMLSQKISIFLSAQWLAQIFAATTILRISRWTIE